MNILNRSAEINERYAAKVARIDAIEAVPRESVVIRVENSEKPFALKLKSAAHYDIERMAADEGEIDTEA